jgi:hypothetical protein
MIVRKTEIQTGAEFRKGVICCIYKKRKNETFLTTNYSRWNYIKIRDGPIRDIEKFLNQLRKDIESIKKAINDEKKNIVEWVEKKCEELIPKLQKIRKEIKNGKWRWEKKKKLKRNKKTQ